MFFFLIVLWDKSPKAMMGDYMQRHPKNWKGSWGPGEYVWDLP